MKEDKSAKEPTWRGICSDIGLLIVVMTVFLPLFLEDFDDDDYLFRVFDYVLVVFSTVVSLTVIAISVFSLAQQLRILRTGGWSVARVSVLSILIALICFIAPIAGLVWDFPRYFLAGIGIMFLAVPKLN